MIGYVHVRDLLASCRPKRAIGVCPSSCDRMWKYPMHRPNRPKTLKDRSARPRIQLAYSESVGLHKENVVDYYSLMLLKGKGRMRIYIYAYNQVFSGQKVEGKKNLFWGSKWKQKQIDKRP